MDKKKIEMCLYLHKNTVTTIELLSKIFNKTKRSIRNDIDEINTSLKTICKTPITVENSVVTTNFKDINITNFFNSLDYYDYTLDLVERRVVIILYAITKSNVFTIYDLSEFMKVSRSTVMKDINKVKSFINIYNFDIITEASKGIMLKEINSKYKFDLILDLVKFDLDNVIRFFNQDEYVVLGNDRYHYKDYIGIIDKTIHQTENSSKKQLTSYSYNILKYFLSIYILTLETDDNENIKSNFKDGFYSHLTSSIHNNFNQCLGEFDSYILRRLLDSLNFVNKEYKSTDLPKIQIITRKFIEDLSSKIKIDLNFDDDLLKNLSKHLSSILNSDIEKIEEFSFVEDLVSSNSELYKVVKDSIGEINNIANRKLSETEISFILIYLITAIEKQKNLVRNINILIICASGLGTSSFIKERVKNVIPYANIYLADTQDYGEYLDNNSMDIVLSTVKLKEELKYIFIKSILEDQFIDELMLELDIIKINKIKAGSQKPDIHDFTEKSKELENKLNLTDILKSDYISFNVEANNWQDSIIKASKILLEKNIIEDKYTEAMIKNIEEYGPYIVISQGVAIPHASSQEGVNKTAMSLIKLKDPVKFGAEGLDPVSYVICLSSLNNEHFYAFFDLVNGLQNEEIKKEFMEAKNSLEMEKVLKKMEDLT